MKKKDRKQSTCLIKILSYINVRIRNSTQAYLTLKYFLTPRKEKKAHCSSIR